MNNYTEEGIYSCPSAAVATSLVHPPATTGIARARMIVMYASPSLGTYKVQIWINANGTIYVRGYNGGTFGDWQKLATETSINTLSDTKADKTAVVPRGQDEITNLDSVSSFVSGTHKVQHGYFTGNAGGTHPFSDGNIDIYIWRNNNGTSDYITQVAYEDDTSCTVKIRGYTGTSGWSAWQDINNNAILDNLRKADGYSKILYSTTNLNSLVETGLYYCVGVTGKPTGASNGYLQTIAVNARSCRQIYTDYNGNMYHRICDENVWSDWKRMYDENSLFVEKLTFSESKTIASGGSTSFNVSVAKSGCTPIGIVGIIGSGTSSIALQEYSIQGNNAIVYYGNFTSSQKTVSNLSLNILYKRG